MSIYICYGEGMFGDKNVDGRLDVEMLAKKFMEFCVFVDYHSLPA
jgi:hypothetical protein